MQPHAPPRTFAPRALRRAVPLAVLAGVASACGEHLPLTYPPMGVPLLVVNTTCGVGPCQPIHVLAFPGTVVGLVNAAISLGTVAGPSACLIIPPSWSYRVINSSPGMAPDTTFFEWTPAQTVYGLAGYPPGYPLATVQPSTPPFVPAQAHGWSVPLPDTGPIQPAPPCVGFPSLPHPARVANGAGPPN